MSEQVEALFLQMMLKSMRDAGEAAGEPTSNETGMYQDMFDKQVALTLSKRQDLGIARLFERQLGGKVRGRSPRRGGFVIAAQAAAQGSSSPMRRAAPSRRRPARTSPSKPSDFVQQVLPTIRQAAAALGVNPLGMLAQAALETGWGQRMPRTADGNSSLNLFGVKAGSEWSGARAVADTVEISGGVAQADAARRFAPTAPSRKASAISPACSRARRAIARRSPRAANAQAYVQSIAKAGYATDPRVRRIS